MSRPSFRAGRFTGNLLSVTIAALAVAVCGDSEVTTPFGPSIDPLSSLPALDHAGTPSAVLLGAGDIADCTEGADLTADLLDNEVAANPGAVVFTLGDNAYPAGSAADYTNCYEPTWGRHKSITRPTLGDEDYETANAQPSFDYFGSGFGSATGYYSFDLGDWHIVVLNDQIDKDDASPQIQWLKADLAANTQSCTAALFHEPRFWSHNTGGTGISNARRPIWVALYEAGVDIVLNGHRHMYERHLPQDADGNVDNDYGIVQFIVGTGGRSLFTPDVIWPNAVVTNSETFGVIRLTLDTGSLSWTFVPEPGGTFTDSGTLTCHDAPPEPPEPPETIDLSYSVNSEDRVRLDWSGANGADVEIYRNGALRKVTENDGVTGDYPGDGVWEYEVCEIDRTACSNHVTATIGQPPPNQDPVADAGGPYSGQTGAQVQLDGTGSTDPDGTITDYAWDFGDGSSGSGASPTHAYASAGSYTATLTVTDDDGATHSATADVTVSDQPPPNEDPVADAGGPYSGQTGAQIQLDGTGSTDPDGTITDYAWDFGDGSSGSGASPTHAYASAGSYTATLTVTDDDGATHSATADVTVSDQPPPNEDPVADAGGPYGGQTGAQIQLDGTGSTDPDGTITDYAWDFGDGSSGSGASPTHAYASAGSYTATLTVTDDDGATHSATADVTVSEPPSSNIVLTTSVNGALRVKLQWSGANGDFVDAYRDGVIFSTTENDGVKGNYPGEGIFDYQICEAGTTVCSNVVTTVVGDPPGNQDPIADAGGPYNAITGNSVSLDGTGSSDADGSIVSYAWDFGDGSNGSGATPSHTYASAGSYTATLTVTDDEGATDTDAATVTVTDTPPPNQPPTADGGGPYNGTVNQNTSFNGSGSSDPDGSIVSYAWDFGDGGSGSGVSPVHVYTAIGTYTVTLTVTDDDGDTDAATTSVTISDTPPSNIVLTLSVNRSGRVKLSWTGAESDLVDAYRDGEIFSVENNDGVKGNYPGPGTFEYMICEHQTSVCSNTATITVP